MRDNVTEIMAPRYINYHIIRRRKQIYLFRKSKSHMSYIKRQYLAMVDMITQVESVSHEYHNIPHTNKMYPNNCKNMHMTNNCFPSRNKRAHNQTSEVATTQKHISHLHHVGKQKSAPGGSHSDLHDDSCEKYCGI